MSKIFIYGPSGWGKSSSLRSLPPENTAILNCDRKPLPLAGWRKKYVTVLKEIPDAKAPNGKRMYPDWSKSNYIETGNPKTALDAIRAWDADPRIKYIIVDTITHLMGAEFMRRILEKGFGKARIYLIAGNSLESSRYSRAMKYMQLRMPEKRRIGQSAAKLRIGERSTTIPQGSRIFNPKR